MNRIDKKFGELKAANQKALIGFISAGDPDFHTSLAVIKSMIAAGIDILELGIPFSDPTADGSLIQAASQRAIKNGMSLKKAFELVKKIREVSEIPIVLFSYYNPIFNFGGKNFYDACLQNGADGALIVDLPIDEAKELTDLFPTNALNTIRLAAPTSTPQRMQIIADQSAGFIYLISQTGVTGKSNANVSEVAKLVQDLKARTDTPICVGLGISSADDVRAMGKISDGVIIGSAFERIIAENLDRSTDVICVKIEKLGREFKAALANAG